jgi:ABC-2 type transport system permease protein
MMYRLQWIGFVGLVRKEIRRVFRIWIQTLVPSPITMTLYILVFGHVIGQKIGSIQQVSYMTFITPGLIMMPIITNSFANTISSFFGARFNKSIEELFVSPLSNHLIILAFVIGSMTRGILNGLIVSAIIYFFNPVTYHILWLAALITLLSSLLFSLLGLLNAIFAKKFDDLNVVLTFILTPAIYLGGIFYEIHSLPPIWQAISRFNPLYYLIDAFRYSLINISTCPWQYSLKLLLILNFSAYMACYYCLSRGIRIKD